jgi:hypothetical protein
LWFRLNPKTLIKINSFGGLIPNCFVSTKHVLVYDEMPLFLVDATLWFHFINLAQKNCQLWNDQEIQIQSVRALRRGLAVTESITSPMAKENHFVVEYMKDRGRVDINKETI